MPVSSIVDTASSRPAVSLEPLPLPSKPSFAIVIPNLHSPVLNHTLAALQRQTRPITQVEVAVVGPDRYGYVASVPWVQHVNPDTPLPPARARNLGVQATHGDVIVFLDADGIPDPGWLERLSARFADPCVTVVGGAATFDWSAGYWTVCYNISMLYPFLAWLPAGPRSHLNTLSLAVRRSALYTVGLFDETYPRAAGEDTDLTLRLSRAGHILHFDPTLRVEHRQAAVTARDVWRKFWRVGYYSPRVDPRYAGRYALPFALRHPHALRAAAPLLAAAVTARIYRDRRLHRRLTWTGVYLSKLAWCLGAAARLATRETVTIP